MDYFNCLKLLGFKVFEPKIYFDYERSLAMGFYDKQVIFVIGGRQYKLTNIILINETNYKLFFTDNYLQVIFISIIKKTTYLWIEIIDCFFNYEKSLIVNSNYAKSLIKFFELSRNKGYIYINNNILDDLILFLNFQDIYW